MSAKLTSLREVLTLVSAGQPVKPDRRRTVAETAACDLTDLIGQLRSTARWFGRYKSLLREALRLEERSGIRPVQRRPCRW
jgi:hypothetical protein